MLQEEYKFWIYSLYAFFENPVTSFLKSIFYMIRFETYFLATNELNTWFYTRFYFVLLVAF